MTAFATLPPGTLDSPAVPTTYTDDSLSPSAHMLPVSYAYGARILQPQQLIRYGVR